MIDVLGRMPERAGQTIDRLLDAGVVLGFAEPGYRVRRQLPGWPGDLPARALAGHHVAITGASSGIGAAAARQLAGLGAHVHLIVRDEDKGRQVAAGLPGDSSVWRCDLADLGSVAECARAMSGAGGDFAGLVHNAGVMPARRTESPQGFEQSMAVHVLGPVLLTESLRPRLVGARVVFVTSGGMYAQGLDLQDLDYTDGPYRATTAYARSKRAQVELLAPLQARWPEITCAAMHPGWVATPGVSESLPRFAALMGPILRDDDAGADTITWLVATGHEIPGARLWHDRRIRPTTRFGRFGANAAERAELLAWVDSALEDWVPGGI